MAFPSGADPLSRALLNVQDVARNLKLHAQELKAATLAGSVSANAILEFYYRLIAAKTAFAAAGATPGIAAYAREQFDNPSLDVAVEFTNMTAAVDACGLWINNNLPKNASNYLLLFKLTAGGMAVDAFTTAQTAGLRTQLDALIATIG